MSLEIEVSKSASGISYHTILYEFSKSHKTRLATSPLCHQVYHPLTVHANLSRRADADRSSSQLLASKMLSHSSLLAKPNL